MSYGDSFGIRSRSSFAQDNIVGKIGLSVQRMRVDEIGCRVNPFFPNEIKWNGQWRQHSYLQKPCLITLYRFKSPAIVAQRQSVGLGDREAPGSKLACAIRFSLRQGNSVGITRWPSSLGMLIGPSRHHCSPIRRAPLHSSVKTSMWCLHRSRKLQSRQ